MARPIYLDYNASTPLAPTVAGVMRSLLEEPYGNPSSGHWAGAPARQAVENARAEVAALLHCAPDEVVFTSGGSEANNHAIKGVWWRSAAGAHFITTAVEHPAVLNPCRFLESQGALVTRLPVDETGMVDPEDVRRAITPRTVLISVMHANNEVGTIQPIAEIGRIARQYQLLFHTDAAQSAGKIPVDVAALGVDLLSLAGHKLYAPKGIGALYVRRGVALESLIHGAGHEAGRRAGTENVLLAAALGEACRLARVESASAAMQSLRDRLWDLLRLRFGDQVSLNGHPTRRLPNTLNVNFHGRLGWEILQAMPEVAVSTGSACHSGSPEISPVLKAMGVPPAAGLGAIRFSLGRPTTLAEVETVSLAIPVKI